MSIQGDIDIWHRQVKDRLHQQNTQTGVEHNDLLCRHLQYVTLCVLNLFLKAHCSCCFEVNNIQMLVVDIRYSCGFLFLLLFSD